MSAVEDEIGKYIKIEVCKRRENFYSESERYLIEYAKKLIGDDSTLLNLQEELIEWVRKSGEGKPDYKLIRDRNICIVEYMAPLVREKSNPNKVSVIEREKSFFFHCWEKIKRIIAQESQWEQSVSGYLNNVAEEHPIIARFIASILSGILIGTLTDCVIDGIERTKQEERYRRAIEEVEEILQLERDAEITLTKEEDSYRVIIKNN